MERIDDHTDIDQRPFCGGLDDLLPLTFLQVRGTVRERLWNLLIQRYHYLGYRKMVGARMKYLVYAGERIIAAIGWTAASYRIRVRDYYIGWSEQQKREHLSAVANNNRLLIMPWIFVKNLGSHLLARSTQTVVADWQARYGQALLLLETFVDPDLFSGTIYRAANWIYVGETSGYGRRKGGYTYHGKRKEVYLYVVERRFRRILGCHQRPIPRESLTDALREGKSEMMIRHVDWDSSVTTRMDISESDMEEMAEELMGFHREFRDCFPQEASQRLGLVYLRGLLSNIRRKNAEGIALALSEPQRVRATQSFMTSYPWDHEVMQNIYMKMLSADVADGDSGVLAVDSSEFHKKGTHSVGVARQYCGERGKVDNCQSGVFISYASVKGYGLVERRLYMPQKWFSEEYRQRRIACQVPEELSFATKNLIALELIKKVGHTGFFPARWLTCDASFGKDQKFRDEVGKEYWYLAAVPANTKVWREVVRGAGARNKEKGTKVEAVEVRQIAMESGVEWHFGVKMAEGAKGPIVADVARLRVWDNRGDLPGSACWLFLRREADGKIKYALSNAPEETRLSEMVRVSTMRWPIEQGFEEGKSFLGMGHYEHRSWPGWHRHMTYVFLAQLFLLRLRFRFKKKLQS